MKTLIAILLFGASFATTAQELKPFSLTNVLNNETISPQTFPACEGMVIIFTSNTCPYHDYYASRIIKLSEAYHDKVPVLLVNSGTDAAEGKDSMVKKARSMNITVPYLEDKDQSLMTNLDARKAPEAFLLKNNGGKFTVVYRGAIDDNPQVESDVRKNYLRDAIDIMLSNQKIETREVRPVGCNLKKKG